MTKHKQKVILNRSNSLCGQINAVLCYFGGLGPVTKLRLFKAYCSSYYGCELCCKAVDDFCIMWRKGLKRVWGAIERCLEFFISPVMCFDSNY